MDKTKIIKKNEPRKIVPINMRITKKLSLWLKEKSFSPTGIFNEAVKDLGYKEKE